MPGSGEEDIQKIQADDTFIIQEIFKNLVQDEVMNTTSCKTTLEMDDQIMVQITVTLGSMSKADTLSIVCEGWLYGLQQSCGRNFLDCSWQKISKRAAGDVYTGTTLSSVSGSGKLMVSVLSCFILVLFFLFE